MMTTQALFQVVCQLLCRISEAGYSYELTGIFSFTNFKLRTTA